MSAGGSADGAAAGRRVPVRATRRHTPALFHPPAVFFPPSPPIFSVTRARLVW